MKEKLLMVFRNNERELSQEIMRLKDAMAKEEPGSAKYGTLLEQYNTLLSQEKELKKLRSDVEKALVAGSIGIVGLLVYRWMINSAEEPFFKEIGKLLLKVVHI